MRRRAPLTCLLLVACVTPAPVHTIEPVDAGAPAIPTVHARVHEDDESEQDSERVRVATGSLKALHAVAEAWRANHGDECPSVQRLIDDKELSASSDTNDPWGSPYKILCNDDNTTTLSFGPDRKEGTRDDLRFPNVPPP